MRFVQRHIKVHCEVLDFAKENSRISIKRRDGQVMSDLTAFQTVLPFDSKQGKANKIKGERSKTVSISERALKLNDVTPERSLRSSTGRRHE